MQEAARQQQQSPARASLSIEWSAQAADETTRECNWTRPVSTHHSEQTHT